MIFKKNIFQKGKNRLKNTAERKGLFFRWFLSYTIILMIPIFLCSYYYIYTYTTVRDSNSRNQTLLLEKAQTNLDTKFTELIEIATRMQLTDSVTSLSYAGDSLTPIQYEHVASLQKELRLFQVANSIISSISLYFPRGERILRANTLYTQDLIGHLSTKYFSESDLYFLRQHFDKKINQSALLFRSEGNRLLFAKKLLADNNQNVLSIMIFELDPTALQTSVLANYMIEDGQILGLLYDDLFVLSSDFEFTSDITADNLQDSVKTLSIHGNDYILTALSSTQFDFELVSLIPQHIYNHETNVLLGTLLATIFACLSVGLITTYFYTARNYLPVKNILDYISPEKRAFNQNEYDLILEHLRHNKTALSEQMELIRNEFLCKILSGEIQYQQINEAVKEKFNFSLTELNLIVVRIHLEDLSNQSDDPLSNEHSYQSDELTYFIIQNVLSELLQDTISNLHFCSIHSDIAVICNTDQSTEEIMRSLIDGLHSLSEFVLNRCHFHMTAGISQLISDPNVLSSAFTQATDALEYIHLLNKAPIYIWQTGMEDGLSTPAILGSSETLVNWVLNSSSQFLEDYFKRVRKELSSIQLSLEEARDTIYFFHRSSLQIRSQLCRQFGAESCTLFDQINNEFSHFPLSDILDLTERACLDACEKFRSYAQSKQEQLPDQICRYIENNYNDVNLNLNNIASHFNMSPAYLSKRFKISCDESVIDYLYHIRIREAIKLFDSELKISDIATLTGFSDSNAFIRIFKKEKGMTPGKYRESQFS